MTLMLVAAIVLSAPAERCVELSDTLDSALTRRITAELRTFGISVRAVAPVDEVPCSTKVLLDESARRFQLLVRFVSGPTVTTETLDASTGIAAAHVAEVVRAALLGVELKARATTPPTLPTLRTKAPSTQALPTEVMPSRFSVGISAAGLLSAGGTSPGVMLQVDGALWLSRWLGAGVSITGPLVAPQLVVSSSAVTVRPWSAWCSLQARWPIGARIELSGLVGAGASWVFVEGQTAPPYIGTTANHVVLSLLIEARSRFHLSGPLSAFIGLGAQVTAPRLAIDASSSKIATFGLPIGTARAGLELLW